jgi:cytochrome bd-type quinol oxidase subunit 2
MAGKMKLLQPLLPGGWLLTGSGALVLRPSALTLLVAVAQAAVLLLAAWVPAWRQARGQDRAQKLVETMGVTPTVIVVGAEGRIEIRYDQDPSGVGRRGKS